MIMEEKEGLNGPGFAVKGDEAPQSYGVEVSGQYGGGSTAPSTGETPATTPMSSATAEVKKKRGRPRKYAADGSVVALSPMPLSASIPLTGDYASWKQSSGKPAKPFKKKIKWEFGSQGGQMTHSVGGSFIPHVITVNAGEDIIMKIISFSQQGLRAICVLAANGSVSNVTLQKSSSSGGTLTYEGHFEILSLAGSFMPNDTGLTKNRTGGMSVSLAGPDGRVFGGGIAGMLVAAGSVQVVIGSFLLGNQLEQKSKKPKFERNISFGSMPAIPVSQERLEVTYNNPNPNLTTSISFHGDTLASANSMHSLKITDIDNNDSLMGEGSGEHNQEITC